MKEYRFQGVGLSRLEMIDADTPSVTGRQVVVSMRAFALNYRDLLVAEGRYGLSSIQGLRPFSDGVGIVKRVGPDVVGLSKGDRVMTSFFRDWTSGKPTPEGCTSDLGGNVDGVLAEEVVLPEHALVPAPHHLADVEAATLPCAGVTAYNALVARGDLLPGQTVLTLGSGGVSLYAIRIASALGARVIATTSDDTKAAWLLHQGAHDVINYKTNPDWPNAVKTLTDGRGVDHVVEVGGVGTLAMSMECLAMGGHIAYIGVLTGKDGAINPFPLLAKSARLDGIYVGSRQILDELGKFMGRYDVRPYVDRIFPFDEVHKAYAFLASGQHKGKVVVAIQDS
ncbi:zinc-dependent alcohol dehydrogenase family protein [Desulfovibrio inopinatus]|uniref:zinc-dependent alcohol dehydrogenase family protein n=1 Tax=Desulfovibrio inopinatus TaxID=102109 RepID=UPI0003FFFC31|nr:NAD(P)-dependent alcohol dehydrogenase [Desulfovibrio inopinatus]